MRIMHSPLTAPEVVPDSRSPRHFCPLALELLRSSNGFHLRTAPGPCFGVCVTSDLLPRVKSWRSRSRCYQLCYHTHLLTSYHYTT